MLAPLCVNCGVGGVGVGVARAGVGGAVSVVAVDGVGAVDVVVDVVVDGVCVVAGANVGPKSPRVQELNS